MKVYYTIPDWEHEGDTDSECNSLYALGAKSIKVLCDRIGEEECEVTLVIDIDYNDFKKFKDYGCYR